VSLIETFDTIGSSPIVSVPNVQNPEVFSFPRVGVGASNTFRLEISRLDIQPPPSPPPKIVFVLIESIPPPRLLFF